MNRVEAIVTGANNLSHNTSRLHPLLDLLRADLSEEEVKDFLKVKEVINDSYPDRVANLMKHV